MTQTKHSTSMATEGIGPHFLSPAEITLFETSGSTCPLYTFSRRRGRPPTPLASFLLRTISPAPHLPPAAGLPEAFTWRRHGCGRQCSVARRGREAVSSPHSPTCSLVRYGLSRLRLMQLLAPSRSYELLVDRV